MNAMDIKDMILIICSETIAAKEELCKLDGHVGDGDHGFTVERGFKAVKKMIESEEEEFENPADVFEAVGDELADTMGGAIGLIMGGFFTGGAEAVEDSDEFGAAELSAFLRGGLDEIKLIGGAKEGDRTLIDALSPACDACQEALGVGMDIGQCIERAADAAKAGAEATANMVAKKGRAKFLQKESKGYVDAGSVTMSIIIKAMSDYINR